MNIGISENEKFSVEEVQAHSEDKDQLQHGLPEGFKLVDSEFSFIEQQSYVTSYSQSEMNRADETIEIYFIQSQIFYKNKLVSLNCGTPPERKIFIKSC